MNKKKAIRAQNDFCIYYTRKTMQDLALGADRVMTNPYSPKETLHTMHQCVVLFT